MVFFLQISWGLWIEPLDTSCLVPIQDRTPLCLGSLLGRKGGYGRSGPGPHMKGSGRPFFGPLVVRCTVVKDRSFGRGRRRCGRYGDLSD